MDSGLLTAADTDLLLAFASKFLRLEYDVTGSGEVKTTAMATTEKTTVFLVSKKVKVWKLPPRWDDVQVSSDPFLHLISGTVDSCSIYEMCRLLFQDMCSLGWMSRLYSTVAKALLAQGRGRLGVYIR